MNQKRVLFIRPDGTHYFKEYSDECREYPFSDIVDQNRDLIENFKPDGCLPYVIKFEDYSYCLDAEYILSNTNNPEYTKYYNKEAQLFCSKTTDIDKKGVIIIGDMSITKKINKMLCDIDYETYERIKEKYVKPSKRNCNIL